MRRALPITVDLDTPEVQLGRLRVPLIRTGDERAFALSGTLDLVRLLSFEERTLLVTDALTQRNPDEALLAALSGPGETAQAVSLALAGGAEGAPPFADIARVCGAKGQSPALLVDREFALAPQDPDGWTEVVFAPPESLAELKAGMIENLLGRGASTRHGVSSPETAAPPAETLCEAGDNKPWHSAESTTATSMAGRDAEVSAAPTRSAAEAQVEAPAERSTSRRLAFRIVDASPSRPPSPDTERRMHAWTAVRADAVTKAARLTRSAPADIRGRPGKFPLKPPAAVARRIEEPLVSQPVVLTNVSTPGSAPEVARAFAHAPGSREDTRTTAYGKRPRAAAQRFRLARRTGAPARDRM
jgi:hypothetical protein